MDLPVLRPGPLNVLVVAAEGGPGCAALLAGLRGHTALVCAGARQAREVAGHFGPDVVLIDRTLADADRLAEELVRLTGGRAAAVAFGPVADRPPAFHDHLPGPVAAAELEQLLWRLGRRPTGAAAPRPSQDREKTG
jgi:hypothetical protein